MVETLYLAVVDVEPGIFEKKGHHTGLRKDFRGLFLATACVVLAMSVGYWRVVKRTDGEGRVLPTEVAALCADISAEDKSGEGTEMDMGATHGTAEQ